MVARARPMARVATSLDTQLVEVLQSISNNTSTTASTLETLVADMKDVRDRVIRLESSDLKRNLEKVELRLAEIESKKAEAIVAVELEERIQKLESERDQVKGASVFIGWLSKHAPWLAAAILAGLAYFHPDIKR